MPDKTADFDISALQAQVEQAARQGLLTSGAVTNITAWLTEPRFADYLPELARHIQENLWKQLDDAFWTTIPFGTGGRRGRMYPIGSNMINDRTIGESAQGLAEYVKDHRDNSGELSCAIAFDTRHRSWDFARLCAEIMVAHGYRVYLTDEIRSTPELSFLVRFKQCSCGIMVTASHNPPSDNAVKVYWSTGGQVLPPHDEGVIQCVMNTGPIQRADYDRAVADGRIVLCKEEADAAYHAAVQKQAFPGPRDLKIIYSPLHGVGLTCALPALQGDGFEQTEVFGPHAAPDGDFPNVPGHVSNPENPAVFDAIIARAQQTGAELILASDPDCDRLGVAAPLTADTAGPWKTFNGNQIAVLLGDYVLSRMQAAGRLTPEHYVVKTIVTTEMLRRLSEAYGVRISGNLLVGFKWIGGELDRLGPTKFVFGAEESHGYLVGNYARDKDGGVASMLMAELAAELKQRGKTLHGHLDDLYHRHGYHAEKLLNLAMQGSDGMARMMRLMERCRVDPPEQLAGLRVAAVCDYEAGTLTVPRGGVSQLDGPRGDMVILDLQADGNYIAVRPSGTEPKVKFYMFTYTPPELLGDLAAVKRAMAERLDGIEKDLRALAAAI